MGFTKQELKQLSKNQLIEIILQLQSQIDSLVMRIAHLEKNSSNSSKPPSSDNDNSIKDTPKPNRSLRQSSGRKPGGQKGHPGITRAWSSNPDKITDCRPAVCSACGGALETLPATLLESRQESDIPDIRPVVTEYRKLAIRCTCGHHNEGTFPSHIRAPMQLGENTQAFLVYLSIGQLIPLKRLQVLCSDLFGMPLCKRSIENILERASQKSQTPVKNIQDILQASSWVGSDETGCHVKGEKWWQWVWQSTKASYYAIEKSRGYGVVVKHFGESFQGTLVHDCWSAQNNTRAGGHQQCLAHIQRDLKFLMDTYQCRWAFQMNKFLSLAQRARDKIWTDSPHVDNRQLQIHYCNKALVRLIKKEAKSEDSKRLQKRITKHRKAILHFMSHPDVPFHNNSSERAIRMAKVKQKISGSFRSETGATRYANLLSIIETAKKQELNIFASIKNLLAGTLVFQPA